MNGATLQVKVNKRLETVEKDVSLLKKAFFAYLNSKPQKNEFQDDEQVWQTIKSDYEIIQDEFLQKFYPDLYAKTKQ